MIGVVLIQLLLIVFNMPSVIRWVRRNKPMRYRPDAIPAAVLPQ